MFRNQSAAPWGLAPLNLSVVAGMPIWAIQTLRKESRKDAFYDQMTLANALHLAL